MDTLQRENEQNGMDLRQIIRFFLARFWIILFAGVFAGMIGLIYTKMTTTPTYTSSTTLYIMEKDQNSGDTSTGAALQLGAVLASDYAQLIKDRTVAESVISELGLSMSAETLMSRISVNVPNSGRIITISATDTDPYMASKIVTTVRDKAAQHIKEVMNSEAVNVAEEANIPQGQTLYNYKRNGIIGFIIGIGIAVGIMMMQFMMNDTIKSADDVERYLGISVLGSIPVIQSGSKSKKGKKYGRDPEEVDGHARSKYQR